MCVLCTCSIAKAAAPAAASSSKAKQPQQPDSKKLAEAAAALRREIAANKTNKGLDQAQQQRDASPSQPEYKTLDVYLRESNAASAAPAPATPLVNAWAKPPAPAPHALGGGQQQQRHRPAEPSRLATVTTARDVSPVSPAAAAAVPARAPAATPRPAAAAPSSGLPPVPHPPPPPPAAAAVQQSHGLHHVPSIHSHPLATQGSTASLVSQASAGLNGSLPVGAEYVGDEGQLTKAQRKNLKRAEKKKRGTDVAGSPSAAAAQAGVLSAGAGAGTGTGNAAAAAAGASPVGQLSRLAVATGGMGGAAAAGPAGSSGLSRHASSTSDSLAAAAAASAAGPSTSSAAAMGTAAAGDAEDEDEDSIALMYELAVHALLAKKTLALVASLQRLGFAEWQAAAAVQRHGSELEDAVAWLLEGGAPDPEAAAAVSAGCVADVSILEELRLMEALGAALPQLPRAQLYNAVADAGGDLDKAAAAAMQQHADIMAAAEAEAAVAAAAAALAAATPAESSCSPMASGSVEASPTSTSSTQHQQPQPQQVKQQQPLQQVRPQPQQPLQQQQHHQQQQLLPNGVSSGEPEYSAFGSSLSLYSSTTAPSAAAAAGAGPSSAAVSSGVESQAAVSSGFGNWFVPGRSAGGLTAHPLQGLASTTSLDMGGPLEPSTSGFGSYVPGSATAAAAAAMGANIWGAGSMDMGSSAAGWGQFGATSSAQQLQPQPGELLPGAASGGLFGQGSLDTGLGGWGSSGLPGHSGLGLLGNQGSVAAEQHLLNPYAPFGSGGGGSLFASSSLAPPAQQQQQTVSTPAAGDAGLQQSRLFSSYRVGQPSLFGTGATQQQAPQPAAGGWGVAAAGSGTGLPEATGAADSDDDFEGLYATLMCH